MTLELIESDASIGADAHGSATFDLRLQPTRPGVAHEALVLELDERLADAVAVAANADGVPSELWATVAIESERAVSSAANAGAIDPACLCKALHAAAEHSATRTVGRAGRRLGEYSRALRRAERYGLHRAHWSGVLHVPYHSLLAWEAEASRQALALEDWAWTLLATLPARRIRWEAAAAERGQTLGEWIALSAARLASS